ncbi:MAG: hypothetical protein NT000_02750 [Proteobacteria bacterium]|nr:hypothetical protein [Pseudomonadota bacterium]
MRQSRFFKVSQILLYIICLSIIGRSYFVKAIHIKKNGIHEDISMILSSSKALNRDGNIRNCGIAYPLQVLRDYPTEKKDNVFRFWFGYLVPVLYFSPFLVFFGDTSVKPFLVGQTVLFVIFVLCWIWIFRKEGLPAIGLTALYLLVRWSLDGSIVYAATQLIVYPLLILFWYWKDSFAKRSITLGILTAIMMDCRSEIAILAGALPLCHFLLGEKSTSKTTWQAILRYLIAVGLTTLLIFGLRRLLGGVDDSDHKIYLMGYDVFEADWNVLFGSKVYKMSDFFHEPYRTGLFIKTWNAFLGLYNHTNPLRFRSDFIFTVITFVLLGLGAVRNRILRFDFVLYIFFILGCVLIAGLGVNSARYFDIVLVIEFFCLARIAYLITKQNQKLAWTIAVAAASYASWQTYSDWPLQNEQMRRYTDNEAAHQKLRTNIQGLIKHDARVIIRHPEFWNWYGDGLYALITANLLVNHPVYSVYKPDVIFAFLKENEPSPTKIWELPLQKVFNLEQMGYYKKIAIFQNP